MEEKKTYVCPLCGTKHDTPKDMAHCILECDEKQRVETERLRRQQLDQEKDKRWEEVVASWERYRDLYYKFDSDYPNRTLKLPTSFFDFVLNL